MKVQSIPSNYSAVKHSAQNVSFGVDCGPNIYGFISALDDLKKDKYIVQGPNTSSAFGNLYDKIRFVMEEKKRTAYEGDVFTPGTKVVDMHTTKENFVQTLTEFWDKCKYKFARPDYNERTLDKIIDEYLVNEKGLKKPNFFQLFLSKYSEFVGKKYYISNVFERFIETGLHRLK